MSAGIVYGTQAARLAHSTSADKTGRLSGLIKDHPGA
jgi:hypothetical protein